LIRETTDLTGLTGEPVDPLTGEPADRLMGELAGRLIGRRFARLVRDFGAAALFAERPLEVFLAFFRFGAVDLLVFFVGLRAFFAIGTPPLTLWP
jgi:hypothetical protein